jgi:hypothetical protein
MALAAKVEIDQEDAEGGGQLAVVVLVTMRMSLYQEWNYRFLSASYVLVRGCLPVIRHIHWPYLAALFEVSCVVGGVGLGLSSWRPGVIFPGKFQKILRRAILRWAKEGSFFTGVSSYLL